MQADIPAQEAESMGTYRVGFNGHCTPYFLIVLFFTLTGYNLKLAMLQAVTVCITAAKFARTTRTIAELVKEKELATVSHS
jgi:hypothetical protein